MFVSGVIRRAGPDNSNDETCSPTHDAAREPLRGRGGRVAVAAGARQFDARAQASARGARRSSELASENRATAWGNQSGGREIGDLCGGAGAPPWGGPAIEHQRPRYVHARARRSRRARWGDENAHSRRPTGARPRTTDVAEPIAGPGGSEGASL